MFELVRNIIFAAAGIFGFYWLMSSAGGWDELAEKYKTDHNLLETFLITENQRISFSSETKSSGMALTRLGIGVSDDGLYLSNPIFPDFLNFVPTLLIPWADIAYRKIAATSSLNEYYTFYLGNPRIARFSLNGDTIALIEQDYGEPISINKLGEPE